nr:uncharacterized protein LOC101253783 isoform X6 [Solanum lycopersicum]
MMTYYYPRPTPQDVLIEEREWNQTNTSYSGNEVYEWNLDALTNLQVFIMDLQVNFEDGGTIFYLPKKVWLLFVVAVCWSSVAAASNLLDATILNNRECYVKYLR